MKQSQYQALGVDPHKAGVRKAFAGLTKGPYNGTFCVVKNDRYIPGNVRTKHGDGSGSKSALRTLYFLETGNPTIFREDPYDAGSMNTSDIGACGFVYGVEMTDHIGINSVNIGAGSKDKILEQFALGFKGMIALYKKFGIKIDFFGGETADLIDPVTSIVFDVDVRSTMPKKLLIKGNVAPDDRIFGLSSAGKTPWEKEENSGIMSNGLTLGSRTLLHKDYMKKYPFLFHPNKPLKGRFDILEPIPQLDMTIGEALLSPTRQWAIIIRMLIDELQSRNALHLLHAICVNTGGGLTKCLNLGKGIRYEKTIPHPPSLFWFIQEECGETWKNMHTTFNCGIGLEIIGSDQHCVLSDALSKICRQSDVKLFSLGACSKSPSGKNEVVIHSMGKKSTYRK